MNLSPLIKLPSLSERLFFYRIKQMFGFVNGLFE